MARKPNWSYISQKWKWLFKAAVFGFFLFAAVLKYYSILSLLLFFAISAAIYFTLSPGRKRFRAAFFLLPIISLFFTAGFEQPFAFFLSGFFAVLFFFLLGISNFEFKNNRFFYYLLNDILLVCLFLILAKTAQSIPLIWCFSSAFLGLWMILREALVFGVEGEFRRRCSFAAAAVALTAAELFWAFSFLPIGFLNIAFLLAIFSVLSRNLLLDHFKGTLTRPSVLQRVSLFIILTVAIFALSKWSI